MVRTLWLLGPLRVINAAGPMTLNLSRRERALVTFLALNPGHVVTTARIIDELWPDGAPDAAGNTVQVYMSRIRRTLGRDSVITNPSGYALAIEPIDVDVVRFEQLADQGARALKGGRFAEAAVALRRALMLWTGEALIDGLDLPAVRMAAVKLAESRLSALEDRIEADLALGRGTELVPELTALADEQPFRERLQAALMIALFHAGRQADALAHYAIHRTRCIDELGMEPGPGLRRLQLSILGGGTDLAPVAAHGRFLTTVGSAASLPTPSSPLLGRSGDLLGISSLVTSGVRLVTLTGPGGTGKTRLAIEVAHHHVDGFPDGVFFVALADATNAEVMWTSIAEVMDLPAEGRTPPALFNHLRHRRGLFVLDNLEQLREADNVVERLLLEGPQLTVIATSRGPLHVSGEHEHPVAPLDLPQNATLAMALNSGAVQMFIQQARMVRPQFELTGDNAADVVQVCRRLDALPLAIELAAARVRILSPRALVHRLEDALELAGSQTSRPDRQQTLYKAINWSYDLLTPDQQRAFRRLGVFAAGADLDGIAAVVLQTQSAIDPLDIIFQLVEASLATTTQDASGEPRVDLLQTIRSYALKKLKQAGDLDRTRELHAQYFVRVVQQLNPRLSSGAESFLEARHRFELEHDNLRAALHWALRAEDSDREPTVRHRIGLQLCAGLGRWWQSGGYIDEGRQWLELAVGTAPSREDADLARCLSWLAECLLLQGDLLRAHDCAAQSVAIWRRLDDLPNLCTHLIRLAQVRLTSRHGGDARTALDEAVSIARDIGNEPVLANGLSYLADLEAAQGNYERSLELQNAALVVHTKLGDEYNALTDRHGMACTLREMGRLGEAHHQLHEAIPHAVSLYEPVARATLAEDYAAVLAELGFHERAAHLLGAADAFRSSAGMPRDPAQDEEIAVPLAAARESLPSEVWDHHYGRGREATIDAALMDEHQAVW